MTIVDFYVLVTRGKSKEGGRALFERLSAQLVRLVRGTVRRIDANPGDWGIDAFVGEFDVGVIGVWQSKFFIDGVAKAQQGEIRDSFNRAVTAAAKEGYKLISWTLCIPRSMDGPTSSWWDSWKKRKEREHDLTIELWDETELEGLLTTPDARELRNAYFGDASASRTPRRIEPVPPGENLDDMLFVKQLHAAEIRELDSAKREFFNAELLARDVADKRDDEEIAFLESVRHEVHSFWSHRYDGRCAEEPPDPLLRGLHSQVMQAIEDHHRIAVEGTVPLSIVHRFGSMHQVVETGAAGWIRDYKKIIEGHGG